MRYLRLRFLINYLTKTKNKKKALLFINTGIFLSIFALTTALVTFYTEKKINHKEFLINETQDVRSELISAINYLEKVNSLRSYTNVTEYINKQDNQLFKETIYGSMAISDKDYYSPFIYSIKNSEILGDDEIYDKESIELLKKYSSPGLQKQIEENAQIKEYLEAREDVLGIEFEKYEKYLFNVSFESLINEINTKVKNKRNENTGNWNKGLDRAFLDYNKVELLINYTINLEEETIVVYRGLENNFSKKINSLENEILKYSKNEKMLILITFLIQFVVFLIIQFFEVSSIPPSLIRKTK